MSEKLYSSMLEIANRTASSKEKKLIPFFLKSYYSLASKDELNSFTNESLFATAYNHFKTLTQYRGKKAIIDVFNPNKDKHGYDSEFSVIDIITQDRPFLIDSLKMAFIRQNISIHFITHPIFSYQLDDKSNIYNIYNAVESSTNNISIVHIEFDKLPCLQLSFVKSEIEKTIKQLDLATNDWQPMSNKIQEVISGIQNTSGLPQTVEKVMETIDFLSWLKNKNFTFLGYREYKLKDEQLYSISKSGLGVLRSNDKDKISKSFSSLPNHLKIKAIKPELLIFSKSNSLSIIHRPAYMDFIGIKKFNNKGEVTGEHRFLGLLTAEAYRLHPKNIPMLSQKIEHIIKEADLPLNSHARKSFENIIAQFPRDELFQSSVEQISEAALGVYHLQERDTLRFFARTDKFESFISCHIYVPKDRYNTGLRRKFEEYLINNLGGHDTEYSTYFSESVHVRVHIMVRTTPGKIVKYNTKQIESDLAPMMLNWGDEVLKLLHEKMGLRKGNSLFKKFEKNISSAYKDNFPPKIAINDFLHINSLSGENPIGVNLYQKEKDNNKTLCLKLYGLGDIATLSDLLPILENFGFIIKSATPYQFSEKGKTTAWIVNFHLTLQQDLTLPINELAPNFVTAFKNTWGGLDESDKFDQLVVSRGISPRDVSMLRAISKYAVQAKAPFSNQYMQQAINNNTGIAELLVNIFHARMGIKVKSRINQQQKIKKQIEEKLTKVKSLDEDLILRWFLNIINAMVRTNFFQVDKDGKNKPYISFKIESAKILDLPLPKPLFEIFVYSNDIEGIHLRGGKVARGGLRWSDRFEDFRTEILGLVKAQIVKNSVIVPVGSKGGFVVKKPDNSSREAYINEGVRCYKIFIRGLLDITDNIIDGKIIAPNNVYRYDEDDPYLVVAADKGTASFSDIANNMAAKYGFWLGDAFASGGSVGYDHKDMGITAKGAWESVKRHFRHLGKNIQEQDFTVIGIGDMSGDVFGNGMLLSKHIQLIAAFNHLHIFIDPTPDAAKTFIERKRLFNKPRSSWEDFDKKLISKGGGVFSRAEKSIKISKEMKKAFSIDDDSLSPNQLIASLLKAPAELLWNGGIGTYIKAESETNIKVGDKANDILRVNGSELKCKVIGEGGNLGLTQLGRIEFAKKGGLILTDAIDNSGGVNCSDHEVNIKILLNQLVEKNNMDISSRNNLLQSMTDEVSKLVLRQNYQQPQAISISEQDKSLFTDHIRIMQKMEKEGLLNREIEFLPNDEELKKRLQSGEQLYSPELAVILAYSKIDVFNKLIKSDLPDASFFQEDLALYFPSPLRKKFADTMKTHKLCREIVATFITNSVLNHMGSVFIHRTKEASGQSTEQIVLAYCAARNIFNARHYWENIDKLDNIVDARLQNDLHIRIRNLLDKASNWFLSRRRDNINIEVLQKEFANISEFSKQLPKVLAVKTVEIAQEENMRLIEQGVPKDLAKELAYMPHLVNALDAIDLAGKHNIPIKTVTACYFGVADKLSIRWLSQSINNLYNNDYWRRRACHSLMDNLSNNVASVTEQVIILHKDANNALDMWCKKHLDIIKNYKESLEEIRKGDINLSRLSVMIGEMSTLARSE